jgi:tight adherence protein C
MWLLGRLMETLYWPWAKRRLHATLVAAGSPKFYTAEEYMALCLLWGLAGGVLLGGLMWLTGGQFSLVSALFGGLAGIGACVYHVSDLASKRLKSISRRVPFTLDLVALAMGAGSTFTEAVRTVTREAPTDPMNAELATVLAEMELGTTRRAALKNLAERVPLDSLRSIVASVIQAEELGTPLADVLRDQSALLRLHRSVRAEKMAALASVRILLPNLLILISVVLCVFAPVIIRAIRGQLF